MECKEINLLVTFWGSKYGRAQKHLLTTVGPREPQDGPKWCSNDKKCEDIEFQKTIKNTWLFGAFGTQGLSKSVNMAPKMAQDGFQDLEK